MRLYLNGLLRNSDFCKLWFAQTISQIGSEITNLALPLTAIQILNATSTQIGILRAFEYIPYLLFGLLSGVLVDRVRRYWILIITDISRGILLLSIPITAFFGLLNIEIFYICAFFIGCFNVFFEVAYWSYLPFLVSRKYLVEGNSKLSLTQSASETIGPGLAGILIQLLGGPFAIIIDALSFIISALFVSQIRTTESISTLNNTKLGIWNELKSGLSLVFSDPILRAITFRATAWNFFYNMEMPIFILFVTRELKFGPGYVGFIFSAMGFGFVIGAILNKKISMQWGVGPTILRSVILAAIASCYIPIANGNGKITGSILAIVLFIIGVMNSLYNINNVSLRQAITPNYLLGRMTATMRFVTWGVIPLAALLSGILADKIGLQITLQIVTVCSVFCAVLGMLFTPLRLIKELPNYD